MTTKSKTSPLGKFEGRDVISSTIAVKNAGDGLSQAMSIDPVAYHEGDEVTIVMRCTVGPITFKRVKDTEAMTRSHAFIAGTATVLTEEGAVAAILDEQERLIEEAKGIVRLDFEDGDDEGED